MKINDVLYKKNSTKTKAAKVLAKVEKSRLLDEARKNIKVSNREKIAVDDPHVPGQQVHGHLESGRAVNKDGSRSHGGKPFYLTKDQANALRRADFNIPKSRLIESEDGRNINVELDPTLIELLMILKDELDK